MTSSTSASSLLVLLQARGFGDGCSDVGPLWPGVARWLVMPIEGVGDRDDWVGFECTRTPRPDERDDWPVGPEALPAGPHFRIAVFRDGPQQPETGIEWWFAADDDWTALIERDDWEDDHPIGFHMWAHDGQAGRDEFVRRIQATPMYAIACRNAAVLTRLFGGYPPTGEITVTGRRA